jgi:signal transduction histidine kinase
MADDESPPPNPNAREEIAAAVEAERHRLAGLLKTHLAEPLNLLLAQANAYEQTLSSNPTARMAVSVLASLARQVLQNVRDLESNLHPAALEALGLPAALETLAAQTMRTYGLQITLMLDRLDRRLPQPLETALFRAAQDALDRAVRSARASHVTIRLARGGDELRLAIGDNGFPGGADSLRPASQRLEELGGKVSVTASPFELVIQVPLAPVIPITPREQQTLQLLAAGLSNKEIAKELKVSPRTVNFHLDNLYSKLGVSSRTEAVVYAIRNGLVKPPSN